MIAPALLLSLALRAKAQDASGSDLQGREIASDTSRQEADLERQVAQRLQSDPSAVSQVAERIARSSVARAIAPSGSADEIAQWVRENPAAAAQLAVGFARDDATGSHLFEDGLQNENQKRRLETNPDSKQGLMGRLNKSARDSKLMGKDRLMTDEERREILKTMFEGKGSESNKIITEEDKGGPNPNKPAQGVPANYFDRLSKTNLRGYSPELQALQSQLNLRRAPGAPPLIETGRLDYATLSYPGYGMRYDVGGLDARLRAQRAYALAKALGATGSYSPAQYADPSVQAELERQAQARGVKVSGRFEARREALARAAAAVQDFDAAALPAKDPLRISRALILGLGSRQKEAARWITVASLEEELDRLDAEDGFLSPELLQMISRCPVAAGDQAAYQRRGQDYEATLQRIKANDQAAIDKLSSDAWQAEMDSVQAALDENAGLRRGLSRHIADFRLVPYYLLSLQTAKPRWRELLDEYVERFLPSTSYGRQLLAVDARRAKLKDVFLKIAMGDLDAAHTILAAEAPSGGPPSSL